MNARIGTALLTLSTTLALPFLALAPASAVTVTIDSKEYDVDVFKGSYIGNEKLFQSPLQGGDMPWWGDPNGDLASRFAEQVFAQLGAGPRPGYGPVFAYEPSRGTINGLSQSLSDPLSQVDEQISAATPVNYAIARPLPPASVPGPLPLFGAAAAFGWSRKLRTRVGGERK
jgi:hypothetical protein